MTEQRVSLTVDGSVATVTISRPERMNALDTRTLQDLEAAFKRVYTSPAIRAMVITGTGRAFSAGGDVKEWAVETATDPEQREEDWTYLSQRVIARLYRLPKPVIAAVNGVAVGAGLDLALACDFRYAAENARFGSVYIRIGYCPDVGGSLLLPRLVGMAKAKELQYTGRIIDAAEALQIGMVEKVVSSEELLSEASAFASKLASGPTIAIGLAKENIQAHFSESSIEEVLQNEQRAASICARTADHKEGLIAVNEKREPYFQGR